MKRLTIYLILSFFIFYISSVNADDISIRDSPTSATMPSYKISDSQYMRLNKNLKEVPPIQAPEPHESIESEQHNEVEMYNAITKEVVNYPMNKIIQSESDVAETESVPPYIGLLPQGIATESVFTPDDRSRVTATTSYPWRTIVKLFITHPSGQTAGCSGAIIDNFHVLTAGHCVYLHDEDGWNYDSWYDSIMVVPGLDEDYMPYYYAWATNGRSYTGWTQDMDHRHDWAVLTLDRNIGSFTGWMGRQTCNPTWLCPVYMGVLNTAGYPGDKGGITMWFDGDNGRTADEYNHWYYMDTMGGQSGSPVWQYDGTSRHILTVHAYGNDGSSSNHGTRLNQDKYDRINTWVGEDTPPIDKADLIDDGQLYSGFSPTTVASGDTSFHVWNDIRNIGTASSGGFYVSYYASTNNIISTSDYLISTDYVPSISAFNYGDGDWSGTFPSMPIGTYYVGWIIDSGGDVAEFDKTNNKAYKDSYQLIVKGGSGDVCSSDSQCYSGYCEGSTSYPARCCSSAPPSDGYYCGSGNVREDRDYYCTSSGSYGYQVTAYDCDDDDGCYTYSTGCEDRDFYCSSGTCIYSYSNTHTDYYDSYVNYCSGDNLRKHRTLHDYYCSSNTCTDHTSWQDDQLVQNCNDDDGCYDTDYRDYYCSGSSCTYTSDNCNDCSCSCGGYNTAETSANGNCGDGKDNDCDGLTDTDPECNVCECSTGACCDGCHYRPTTYKCEEDVTTDYECVDGTGCGQDVYIRHQDRYCSGSSASCTGSLAWDTPSVYDNCDSTERCANDDPTCNYDVSCVGCTCGSWTNQGCGQGSCSSTQMYQIRTCTPSGCDIEEQCVDDPSCSSTCDDTSYTTCGTAYSMSDSETKGNMCGEHQYYKITTTKTCDISWTMDPTDNVVYDMHTKATSDSCPSLSDFDCRPYNWIGETETCTHTGLPPGTYYAYVHHYDYIGTYSINAELSNCIEDLNKFIIKDDSGNNVAWFGDSGNVVIKGTLEESSTYTSVASDLLVIRNSGEDVLIIDEYGNMYLDGNLYENQVSLSSDPDDNDFRINDADSNLVSYADETGNLYLKGILEENGNP